MTRIADPTGATWLREYDAGGNLTASVDPVGTRYQATYDDANRVTALHDGHHVGELRLRRAGPLPGAGPARRHERPHGL